MTEQEFLQEQRRAIERMNEMYKGQQIKTGGFKMPPAPSFVKVNNDNSNNNSVMVSDKIKQNEPQNNSNKNATSHSLNSSQKTTDFLGGIKLPFLKNGFLDKDISLILGLILILANEKADRRLLLALLYILM